MPREARASVKNRTAPAARRGRAPAGARRADLRIRDFLELVHEGMRGRLGPRLDGLSWRQRFGYIQYYRRDPAVHFEVWVQRRTGRLELGLHFERDRDRSYAAAELLALRSSDIQAAVGPEYELEEWTRQWTRLHRSFAAPALTAELADDAAERAVALIRGLEPILDQMEIQR